MRSLISLWIDQSPVPAIYEIESEKVDNLKDFRAKKHIRGVRLHFIPESYKGSPELYSDIKFERDRTFKEE